MDRIIFLLLEDHGSRFCSVSDYQDWNIFAKQKEKQHFHTHTGLFCGTKYSDFSSIWYECVQVIKIAI